MKYATVCSGIEAPTVAWHPLGWEAAFYSEIEPFPCAVLSHHYPEVPNYGDMTKFKEWPDYELDLICAGTPCQAFSVAGLRKGLDDPRGNLTLVFLGVLERYRPRWMVWENVPGVLSDDGGAFGTFLRGLAQLGYGTSYHIYDAQYAGVPQRRRRVFVVGYLGNWRYPAAVLFERESLCGNPPPSREKGERVAGTVKGGSGERGYPDPSDGNGGGLTVAYGGNNCSGPIDVATCCQAHSGPHGRLSFENETFIAHTTGSGFWKEGMGTLRARSQESHEHLVAHSLRAEGFDASEDGTGRGVPVIAFMGGQGSKAGSVAASETTCPTIRSSESGTNRTPCVAQSFTVSDKSNGFAWESEISPTLDRTAGKMPSQQQYGVRQGMAVRRLTPRECERLQGFPDDYTLIPMRKRNKKAEAIEMLTYGKRIDPFGGNYKWSADGPRYKALGNSMAVPEVKWIGKRIEMMEEVIKTMSPDSGRSHADSDIWKTGQNARSTRVRAPIKGAS